MSLYSKNGGYPKPIPSRIRMPDGSTRTDSSTYTPQEIADAGYVLVPDPPVPGPYQRVTWDGTNWGLQNWSQSEIDAFLQEQEDQTVKQDVIGDPQIRTFLRNSPVEIETYIDTNVTDVASVKEVLKVLAKTVSALARIELREIQETSGDGSGGA